jgi:DNA-binding response OmpR family regulator
MTRRPSRSPDVALVVGADTGLLEVIQALLMEETHVRVITALTAALALSLLETTAPGIVLVDLNLPGQGGWGILAALRQHPRFRTLPVLLLTAAGSDASRVASLNDPWVELLLKPLDLDALLQHIHQVVQQHRDGPRKAQPRVAAADDGTSLPTVSHLLLLGDDGK